MRKADLADEGCSCTCGEVAQRYLEAPSFGFAHAPNGAQPQNTGISGIDHSWDRTVGRDAEARWKGINERVDRKRKVLADNPGSTGFDLSRQNDGGYRVMRPEERKAAETGRDLHHEALRRIDRYVRQRRDSTAGGEAGS